MGSQPVMRLKLVRLAVVLACTVLACACGELSKPPKQVTVRTGESGDTSIAVGRAHYDGHDLILLTKDKEYRFDWDSAVKHLSHDNPSFDEEETESVRSDFNQAVDYTREGRQVRIEWTFDDEGWLVIDEVTAVGDAKKPKGKRLPGDAAESGLDDPLTITGRVVGTGETIRIKSDDDEIYVVTLSESAAALRALGELEGTKVSEEEAREQAKTPFDLTQSIDTSEFETAEFEDAERYEISYLKDAEGNAYIQSVESAPDNRNAGDTSSMEASNAITHLQDVSGAVMVCGSKAVPGKPYETAFDFRSCRTARQILAIRANADNVMAKQWLTSTRDGEGCAGKPCVRIAAVTKNSYTIESFSSDRKWTFRQVKKGGEDTRSGTCKPVDDLVCTTGSWER